MTVTVDAEHIRAALEALEAAEQSPLCSRFKAARKGIRGAIYASTLRDLEADGLPQIDPPALLRRQA